MTDDELKKSAYLQARGWLRNPFGKDGQEWFVPGQPGSTWLTLDVAAAKQLKADVVGFVYMLDAVDETRPGTRKLIGDLLTLFVYETLSVMFKDPKFQAGVVEVLKNTAPEALTKMMKDPEFRSGIEALRMLWHMTDETKKAPKAEPN